MKIYLSADMEGVCGIADWKETMLDSPQGAYFRSQMTREVAAACEGALEAGADEILVKDAHDSGRNIDPSKLPRQVKIMRSWTKDPYSMMAGLDADFAGTFYLAYHSAAGTDGNPLAHTMNTQNVWVKVNGAYASEFMLNAYTSFSLGVPALLMSGDAALAKTAELIAPGILTVPVSEGIGNASLSIHPDLAIERIKEGAYRAVSSIKAEESPSLPPSAHDYSVEIRFREHWRAHRGSFYPGAKEVEPGVVTFKAKAWKDALTFMHFVL